LWPEFVAIGTEVADPVPFAAMRAVLRLHRSMTDAVDAVLKPGFHLRLIDYEVLTALGAAPTERLLSAVARELGVHATTVSIAIDRLLAMELVTRAMSPRDRRASLVRITDAGREVAASATSALAEVDFGLSGLDDDEIGALVDTIGRIRHARR
jgi:DNA-binding MarR family transcriptional regulator